MESPAEIIEPIDAKRLKQKIDKLEESKLLHLYLEKLSTHSLVVTLKEQVSVLSREQLIKSYGKRRAAILITLFVGAAVAGIGSLTFLVGRQFPQEFAQFVGIEADPDIAHELGKFLGWTNVAIEAIFYTWTISRIMPPFQPDLQIQHAAVTSQKQGFFSRCWSKAKPWLPSVGEWVLAVASAIPLTFVSLLDQEKENREDYATYGIVASIALVTIVSNKFFLSLTHGQFKQIGLWLHKKRKKPRIDTESELMDQLKQALIQAARCAETKLKTLSQNETLRFVADLKNVIQPIRDEENQSLDERWLRLLAFTLSDLTIKAPQINKKAIVLIPTMAIFAALSWLGVIATVPNGVAVKLNASSGWQYVLTVIAGIPLIEIGLSLGGSFGLQLSRVGNGLHGLVTNLTHPAARLLGYIPITLFGLASFATNATLTIQEFKSTPALVWTLLPSAMLGIDLINILSGIELWNDILVEVSTRRNKNKKLFSDYVKYIDSLIKLLDKLPPEEIALIMLALDSNLQKNIIHYISSMQGKDIEIFLNTLCNELSAKLPEQENISFQKNQKKSQINISLIHNWMSTNKQLSSSSDFIEMNEITPEFSLTRNFHQ